MSPTTEEAPRCIFHVLRDDGKKFDIPADTICDLPDDPGRELRFKRGGERVGVARGKFLAWWVDTGEGTRRYHYELKGHMIEIKANEDFREQNPPKTVLKIGENIVGTIYSTMFDTCWYEDDAFSVSNFVASGARS